MSLQRTVIAFIGLMLTVGIIARVTESTVFPSLFIFDAIHSVIGVLAAVTVLVAAFLKPVWRRLVVGAFWLSVLTIVCGIAGIGIFLIQVYFGTATFDSQALSGIVFLVEGVLALKSLQLKPQFSVIRRNGPPGGPGPLAPA